MVSLGVTVCGTQLHDFGVVFLLPGLRGSRGAAVRRLVGLVSHPHSLQVVVVIFFSAFGLDPSSAFLSRGDWQVLGILSGGLLGATLSGPA